ncbi:hypothetical protein PHYSODRAFT_316006 [Phytophthora sojae]|uniref:Uncharacterized protein n=1 Tax=Phytophthora sojae (strain P6497) TaxID=1094619 RepID=G4ZPQ1_PHYSP|nr:hypothetical protein PHYSODRAFT_316006 [Phytophthora sojae]EGZ15841.1 hypothetical protein PHYSODRAFT_316006 [Phytophthora sojae]|eukprot:XP_009529590.1 hypothetical protein PHYSODRAFT_316006 [Phytophthora sojae]
MVLTNPFDLALYTPQYKQPDSPAKNFHDGDAAWTRFLAARPLFYLPDRSAITDEDPINRHRRLWTHHELQTFGDVVEEWTCAQLRAQERTLRRWHQSATHVQRCFRGMLDRMYVLRLRQELFEYAATLERAMELARERRRRRKAAVAIQRGYRCHRKLVIRQQRAAVVLQNASKRFMQRLRRWNARVTMQRAARFFLWRVRWQRYRQRVRKMLDAAARQRKLALATKAFLNARENALHQRQVKTWADHPERMQMLLRARQRQQKLRLATGRSRLQTNTNRLYL